MEESVKFTVFVAENGHSFELACPATTTVELVQTWLVSLACIPRQDQLLICDDARLEPQRTLASYEVSTHGRHIFLYNRVRLMADAPPPPPEQVQVKELIVPSPPSASLCGHPLDDASDPALKALPLYERQFRYHLQKAHAIFTASQDKYEACKQLHREHQVQQLALATAKASMERYYKLFDQNYMEFMKPFTKQTRRHAKILANFDKDLECLMGCRLHPSLVLNGRNTLADCLDVSRLRKCAEGCATSHKQFQGKVLQLKVMYQELQQDVKALFESVTSLDFRNLEQMIGNCARIIEEESSIMQSLSKDVDKVKKLVDDSASNHVSVSLRPHDAVSALGPMYDVHDKTHLPRIEACYKKLGDYLNGLTAKKNEMSVCVHKTMQRVASLQSNIRDMRYQLSAFKEAMARQDETFWELKLVQRIGPAYRACLAEVVRRKSDMKLYMGQAGQLAEKMARIREVEVARREEFLRAQSRFIPRDILVSLGLFGAPSQCLVNIEPYDTNLLDIDMNDLEKYAPESALGPHSKGASYMSNSRETSFIPPIESGSVYCGIGEDSNLGTSYNLDLASIEDMTSEEIAGTSKLEVENARLKAELASAIARLCTMDPDLDAYISSEDDESKIRTIVAEKTNEALALKDEYAKHLEGMVKAIHLQCSSYEKRVRELEQRLSDQYNLQKSCMSGANGQFEVSGQEVESNDGKCDHSVITGEGRMLETAATAESMDDGISSPFSVGVKTPVCPGSSRNEGDRPTHEGVDETMSDPFVGSPGTLVDTKQQLQVGLGTKDHSEEAELHCISGQLQGGVSEIFVGKDEKTKDDQLERLRGVLSEKEIECAALQEKLDAALKDAECLRRQLQDNSVLLNECQMNCAELENTLHLAREEARTKQCSADRKAAEYNSLRTSSVRLRGLVERLRQAVTTTPSGTAGFSESLRSFATSLASNEMGDDGTVEFRACVRTLAERVGLLAQQRAELQDRYTVLEASKSRLAAELESKTDLLKSQYNKRKVDKQAYKGKICYTRFQVHELAIFSPNSFGHYEAINHGCPNYYLSDESLALFLENLPASQRHIIGQIVHIERNVAQEPSESSFMSESGKEPSGSLTTAGLRCRLNPYGLPAGTDYFVVTLAMVPDHISFGVV